MASNNGHWPPCLYTEPFNTLPSGPSPPSYPLSESIIKHPLGTDGASLQKEGGMTEQSYIQANCYEPQPASPQAGENVGFHSHGKATIFQNPDEYALVNHTIGFHDQETTFSNMQKSFMGMTIPRQAVPQSCKRQRHNEPNSFAPLQFISLPENDNTARGLLSTKSPLLSTHCKRTIPAETDFSLIDQFVARNNPALVNILSNLKRCDAARLENFYRSAFEGLGLDTCAAILHLWMRSLSPEALVGIQNTYSTELTYPGLCFQDPSTLPRLTIEDMREVLYHILRGNHGEKIPFKGLLEALRVVTIEDKKREEVEMRLLLREIEIWREIYQ